MVKEGRPRRGSLQFSPRKRARSLLPRVRSWSDVPGVKGFVGYKVGTLTVMVRTTNPNSPLAGKSVAKVATVVETPPMVLRSVRLYKKTPYGARVFGEFANPQELEGVEADFLRFMFETQPKLAGFPKKRPEEVEIEYGGSLEDAISFVSENIGKEIHFKDVFSQNEFADFTGVTKGKGLQGPVKRFGVKLLSHKTEKSRRKPGSLGPWTPKKTPWQVPMAGQMGFHTRTEYNKQILKLGSGLNPKGGWKHYGLVRSEYALVLGTLPGTPKRPLIIRKPSRPSGGSPYELLGVVVDGKVVS